MELTADGLERVVVVRFESLGTRGSELVHLCLDCGLVDPRDSVMLERIDAERFAERGQQMLFVQLRVTLDRVLVLHPLRDFAQLLDRLRFQLMKCVRHRSSGTPKSIMRSTLAAHRTGF